MDIKIGVAFPIQNYRFNDLEGLQVATTDSTYSSSDTSITTDTYLRPYFPTSADIRKMYYQVGINGRIYFIDHIDNYDIYLDRPLGQSLDEYTLISINKSGLPSKWNKAKSNGNIYLMGSDITYSSLFPYSEDGKGLGVYYGGSSEVAIIQKIPNILQNSNIYIRKGIIYNGKVTTSSTSSTGYLNLLYKYDEETSTQDRDSFGSILTTSLGTTWVDSSSVSNITADSSFLNNYFNLGIYLTGNSAYWFFDGIYLEHAMNTSDETDGVYSLDKFPKIGVNITKIGKKNKYFQTINGTKVLSKNNVQDKWRVNLAFNQVETLDIRALLDWQRKGHFLNLHMGEDWYDLVPPVLYGKFLIPNYTHDFWKLDRASFSLTFQEV